MQGTYVGISAGRREAEVIPDPSTQSSSAVHWNCSVACGGCHIPGNTLCMDKRARWGEHPWPAMPACVGLWSIRAVLAPW